MVFVRFGRTEQIWGLSPDRGYVLRTSEVLFLATQDRVV